MTEKLFCVYKHTSPSGKVYIGQTCLSLNNRFRNGKGYSHCTRFYAAIKKYGWKNFITEVLASNLSKEEADKMEIDLIAKYKSDDNRFGYNSAKGGASLYPSCKIDENGNFIKRSRLPLSDEHKNKIREGNKGKIISIYTRELLSKANRGKKRSDDVKKHMSEIYKGIKRDPLLVKKTADALRGRKLSKEHCEHISKGRIGIISSNAKKVICIETDEVYESARQASIALGSKQGNKINICCKNQSLTYKGYHWEYAN